MEAIFKLTHLSGFILLLLWPLEFSVAGSTGGLIHDEVSLTWTGAGLEAGLWAVAGGNTTGNPVPIFPVFF